MGRNVALDNPAVRRSEDAFNRSAFSERLAATIVGFDASEGAPVLGLFGKWGYGKSTVLNFVKAVLEDEHAQRVVVLMFNPWLFKDQEGLLLEFFRTLAKSVDAVIEKRGSGIGEMMMNYGCALSVIPGVGNGLGKVLESTGKTLADDTVQAKWERLRTKMAEATRKVVVIIDDLDRLDREEVMAVLKTVRLSANFPNVVYLLAFDEERVARVAAQAYGESADGRQFLEKIIQYPFSLPAVSPDRLTDYVMEHAQAASEAAATPLTDAEWSEFRRICRGPLLVRLGTPRQAIRYANALRFALPMLKGEVDPLNQMLVEALRILFPEAYEVIRHRSDVRVEDFKDVIGVKGLQEKEIEAVEEIGRVLLRFDARKPMSNARYHGRHFSYAVAPDDVADAEFERLLELAEGKDREAVNEAVLKLVQSKSVALIERVTSAVDNVRLSIGAANRLAMALCKVGGVLPSVHEASAATIIAKLASCHMLRRKKSNNFITPAILEQPTFLPFALEIFRALERKDLEDYLTNDLPDLREGDQLTRHGWANCRAILLDRIKADAQARPPYLRSEYTPHQALFLLQFWKEQDSASLRLWIEGRLRGAPSDAPALLRLFPDMIITFDLIADFAESSVIIEALKLHFGDSLFSKEHNSDELHAAQHFMFYDHLKKTRSAITPATSPQSTGV